MAKVLVVDDDPDMRELVRMTLEGDGYAVDTEADGSVLTAERCRRYDILLLDVMMPGEDGFSICNRIRNEVDCPILFLTAKTDDAALEANYPGIPERWTV